MEQSNYGKSLQSISLHSTTLSINHPPSRVRTYRISEQTQLLLYKYMKLPSIVLLE